MQILKLLLDRTSRLAAVVLALGLALTLGIKGAVVSYFVILVGVLVFSHHAVLILHSLQRKTLPEVLWEACVILPCIVTATYFTSLFVQGHDGESLNAKFAVVDEISIAVSIGALVCLFAIGFAVSLLYARTRSTAAKPPATANSK